MNKEIKIGTKIKIMLESFLEDHIKVQMNFEPVRDALWTVDSIDSSHYRCFTRLGDRSYSKYLLKEHAIIVDECPLQQPSSPKEETASTINPPKEATEATIQVTYTKDYIDSLYYIIKSRKLTAEQWKQISDKPIELFEVFPDGEATMKQTFALFALAKLDEFKKS